MPTTPHAEDSDSEDSNLESSDSENSDSQDSDIESWLQSVGEEENPREKKAKLSEMRTVRFSEAAAGRLDRLAQKLEVSVPALIRDMCSEEASHLEAAENAIDQLYELVEQLADLQRSGAEHAEEAAQKIRRQAKALYEEHRSGR